MRPDAKNLIPVTYQDATRIFSAQDREALGKVILEVSQRVAVNFTTADQDALAADLAVYLLQKVNNCRRAEVILDFMFTVAKRRAWKLVKRERAKAQRRANYADAKLYTLRMQQRRNAALDLDELEEPADTNITVEGKS